MTLGPTMAEKTSMGRRKYNLTRGTGALKRCIAERDRDGVKSQLDKLKVLFTLTFQIGVHIRLFIFRNIAVLYVLIRVYTFIRFVSNPPYTIFIWSMFITLNII